MRSRLAPVSRFVLLALVLLGAVAPAAATQDVLGRTLRINWGWFPETLDPQRSDEEGQWGVSGGIDYEGLTRIDEELQPVPGAAESWDFNADGTILTFHLREGLFFSDGVPVTAEHFRYAAERLCSPELKARSWDHLYDVVGCEELFNANDEASAAAARAALGVRAIDDRTLEYRFDRPAPYFLVTASKWGTIPLRQELVEAGGSNWWANPATRIGNGPFKLVTYDGEGSDQRLVYARNDHHWSAPKLDSIEFSFVDYSDERNQAMYDANELDMTWPNRLDFSSIEADPVLSREFHTIPAPGATYYGFNFNREPFQDPKVREAFAYAFDRLAYSQQICLDACEPSLSWIAPGTPGHIETNAFAFNPEKAREALAASSYGGPEQLPPIDWYWYVEDGDDAAGETAVWFQAMFRQTLGVELNVAEVPQEVYDAQFNSDETWPQLTQSTWFAGPDPRDWFKVWRCGSEFNPGGYCNPALDALLDRADAEMDPANRIALYEEAGRILVADLPAIFVFSSSQTLLIKPHVTGYSPSTPIQWWPGFESLLTIDVNRPD